MRLLLAALLTLLPFSAAAACGGKDLMSELRRTDPAAHAEIVAAAAEVPNGVGRFWRVARAGAPQSWLYGTIHSTEAAARGLIQEAAAAREAARVVMVELTAEEQARMEDRIARDIDFILADEPLALERHLGPEALATARERLGARGMSLEQARMLKPWLMLSLLSIPVCEMQALAAGATVLDQRIAAEAAAAGQPVLGLETYEEALGSFDAVQPAEMTDLVVDAFRGLASEEDLRRTLESLYSDGQIAAVLTFNAWYSRAVLGNDRAEESLRALEEAILVARNRLWLDRLLPELEEGGVFAAVGALHLIGEGGLVALLREAGWTVTRAAR